jgi:galactosylceramidase
LKLQFKGTVITGYVDGKPVLTATDGLYGKGMAGLMVGADAQKFGMPYFDNVTVNQVNGSLPGPAAALPGQGPIYRRSK